MVSLATLLLILKFIGGVVSALTLLFGVFKVINWVKNKFINIDANVTALKDSMETGLNKLSDDIKSQTHTIATELKEQRQDFRTFYAPILMMQQMQQSMNAAPVRAKRSPRKKK
jgi:hypothetical protein